MAKSFREQVVEDLIKQMEAGTAPWQKPWKPGVFRTAPFNPTNGRDYRGMNNLWLEMRGFKDPRWLTYRQAAGIDAQVRKGERGTRVEYWQWSERHGLTDEAGKPLLDEKGRQRTKEVRLQRPKVFHAVVFNAEQLDGMEPYVAPAPTFDPVERAEKALKDGNVPIFHDQADRAFYVPMRDEIHLPTQGAFKGQYEYYATALHELGHATGHRSRMDREFGPFGSETYAREELRAEIASYMLTTELGLGHYPERHANYVEGWLKAVGEDRNVLFQAARDAENIRTWVMEPEQRLALIPHQARAEQKDRPLDVASIKKNWLEAAAGSLQLTDGKEMGGALDALRSVRWHDTSPDNPSRKAGLDQDKERAIAIATDLAGRSPLHAALLSVAWEQNADLNHKEPSWLVNPRLDSNALVRELATDPVAALTAKAVGQRQEEKAMEESQNAERKRRYLNVPYSERKDAKALGARWDRVAKSWYVNDGADLKPFSKWAEQTAPEVKPAIKPEEEFAAACRDAGLILQDAPQMDGKWHRVQVEGDGPGQRSGSYRGFLEGVPAGNITNYKMAQDSLKWVSSAAEIDPAEIERSRAEAAARKAQAEADLKEQYSHVAKRAYGILKNAERAPHDHVYLQRKQVTGETLKVNKSGQLLMPLADAGGFVHNLQAISPDGTKLYMEGGRKSGLMHMLPGKKDGPILIAEGYATAKSLQSATNLTAAVAMDGGNLGRVAEALKERYPDREQIIVADDDHKVVPKVGRNPGLEAAEKAATRTGAKILRPMLTEDEKAAGLSDFNDIHVSRGKVVLEKVVKEQLKALGVDLAAKPKKAMAMRPKKTNQPQVAM